MCRRPIGVLLAISVPSDRRELRSRAGALAWRACGFARTSHREHARTRCARWEGLAVAIPSGCRRIQPQTLPQWCGEQNTRAGNHLCRHRVCAGGGPPECRVDCERRASHLAAFQGRPVARQFPRYTGNRLRLSYRLVGLCNGGSKQVFSKVFVILIVAILISLPEISTRCTPTPSEPPADHRATVAPRFTCPLLPAGRVV